jgi:hypothetical protein
VAWGTFPKFGSGAGPASSALAVVPTSASVTDAVAGVEVVGGDEADFEASVPVDTAHAVVANVNSNTEEKRTFVISLSFLSAHNRITYVFVQRHTIRGV